MITVAGLSSLPITYKTTMRSQRRSRCLDHLNDLANRQLIDLEEVILLLSSLATIILEVAAVTGVVGVAWLEIIAVIIIILGWVKSENIDNFLLFIVVERLGVLLIRVKVILQTVAFLKKFQAQITSVVDLKRALCRQLSLYPQKWMLITQPQSML